MSHQTVIKFRPDIEGLRALAVLSVLAFHHQWGHFPGGFVGVDVFFVISGYLITRNIYFDSQAERFSFSNFYIRRLRRLYPALFVTVVVTLGVGVVVSAPRDLENIAASSLASIFSVSNVYFWNQSGYFDAAAIQKPLLHTWSLAVEEQFYLFWPVIVTLIVRYVKWQWGAVVVLTIIGAISVFAAQRSLAGDPMGVFFLTPYRIGEFALGAICVWLPSRQYTNYAIRELLPIVALGMVIYPVYNYSDSIEFPGVSALLPCLGAALLIVFSGGNLSRWLLCNPVATGIGKISYSLYLIHWPVYVFARQVKGVALSNVETLCVSMITFVFAAMMYKCVEQPCRVGATNPESAIPNRKFSLTAALSTVCLVIVSANIWASDGWPWRYSDQFARFVQETDHERNARFSLYATRCSAKDVMPCTEPTQGINIFIIGDSHAEDIFNALAGQYPKFHYVFYGLGGCPPLAKQDNYLLTAKHPTRDACIARNEKLLYGNQLMEADLIVINAIFQWYKPMHLSRAVRQIRKSTTAPIVVFGNYLIFDDDLPDLVVKHGIAKMDDYYADRLTRFAMGYEDDLVSLSKNMEFTYISKRGLLCTDDSIFSCPIIFDGKLATYDRHHLSRAAAKQLGYAINEVHSEIFRLLEKEATLEQSN